MTLGPNQKSWDTGSCFQELEEIHTLAKERTLNAFEYMEASYNLDVLKSALEHYKTTQVVVHGNYIRRLAAWLLQRPLVALFDWNGEISVRIARQDMFGNWYATRMWGIRTVQLLKDGKVKNGVYVVSWQIISKNGNLLHGEI